MEYKLKSHFSIYYLIISAVCAVMAALLGEMGKGMVGFDQAYYSSAIEILCATMTILIAGAVLSGILFLYGIVRSISDVTKIDSRGY